MDMPDCREDPTSIAEWLEASVSPDQVISGNYTYADLIVDLQGIAAELASADAALAGLRDKLRRVCGER